MRLLNLDLEKTTFIKNDDNTYTVYQLIGDSGVLKLPRVSIELKAEAFSPNTNHHLNYGEEIAAKALI